MKKVIVLLMALLVATPCFAGGCQDTQDAAHAAMSGRNGRVKDTHNILVPDPEEERGWLFDILGTINVFGDGFCLGITLPSLQELIGMACDKVEHNIQDKISEAQHQAMSKINSIGGNNPLQVNGNTSYINSMTGKIK